MKTQLPAVALVLMLGVHSLYAEEKPVEQPQEAPAPESPQPQDPKPAEQGAPSEQPSAEEVLKDLLKKRAESPLQKEGKSQPDAEAKPEVQANQPITPVESNKPIGTAPKAIRTPIAGLPDGAMIVARKGRMTRIESTEGPAWLLTFDSDSSNLDDPPLKLLPCRELERAEALLESNGPDTALLVFGQVFTYRGQSFLMPTQLRVAPNRGNFE